MARFNNPASTTPRSPGVLETNTRTPDMVNHEGALAYSNTPKSELFLLGVNNFVGANSFYESAADRDARFARLAREVAVADGEWFTQFVRWLRSEGNMRTAPLVAAAEGVQARLAAGKQGGNRQIIAAVLQRADEPGELISYWKSQGWGEARKDGFVKPKLPYPVKMGINDAIEKLVPSDLLRQIYTEYSALKYDTDSKAVRFADVVELTHPKGFNAKRDQFYTWLLDRRHNRVGTPHPEGKHDGTYPLLRMVEARRVLETMPQQDRKTFLEELNDTSLRSEMLQRAGVTWEWLASWLGSSLDATFWEAMIPQMDYMALLRNLRNFDKTGVSKSVARRVAEKLADPEQVARSRQFPFRFLSAYENTDSDRWREALGEALTLSTRNIPELPGRTLILIDTSASMGDPMNSEIAKKGRAKSGEEPYVVSRVKAAALFGTALGLRNGSDADVRIFANNVSSRRANPTPSASVLRATEDIVSRIGEVGHGTQIAQSIRDAWDGHDRVFVFTDEQTFGDSGRGYYNHSGVAKAVPANVPIYSFNLAGYAGSMMPSGSGRYQLGGLTDATFRMVPLLERGVRAQWPWEDQEG